MTTLLADTGVGIDPMSPAGIVLRYYPGASDEFISDMLWDRTAYPLCDEASLERQVKRNVDGDKHGQRACYRCGKLRRPAHMQFIICARCEALEMINAAIRAWNSNAATNMTNLDPWSTYLLTAGTTITAANTNYIVSPTTWYADASNEVAEHIRRLPPPREFNPYINASDMLEEFFRFLGTEQVRKREVFKLPLDLFVKWLIIRACEADGEEPPVTLELPAPKQQPRCLGCQRFLPAGVPVLLHGQRCAGYYYARIGRLVA